MSQSLTTGNPALSIDRLTAVSAQSATDRMSISGTIGKTLLLLFIFVATMAYIWSQYLGLPVLTQNLWTITWIASFCALIVGFICALKPETIKLTSILYAGFQGLAIGAWTVVAEYYYPGVAIKAAGITTCMLFATLLLYKTGLIKATDKFKSIVILATVGIMLFYLLIWVLSLFGLIFNFNPYFLSYSGILLLPLIVVGIAALNLILDFDTIDQAVAKGASKQMEWYSAYGLILTLIWLYISIIRLLIRSQR